MIYEKETDLAKAEFADELSIQPEESLLAVLALRPYS